MMTRFQTVILVIKHWKKHNTEKSNVIFVPTITSTTATTAAAATTTINMKKANFAKKENQLFLFN